jgi:hypothetical protein
MEQPVRRTSPLGAVLLVIGLAIMAVVMAADVGGTEALEALAIQLGLAVAPLLLAVGLSLALFGAWLMWRARGSPK